MKVSLIITTYNRPDALNCVIQSAMNQSELPDEIVVADDGSTNETMLIVQQWQRKSLVPIIHCWHEDTGFRLSAIRNKAIAISCHEYIIMVDGDIVLHRHFIRSHKQRAALNTFLQGSRVLLSKKKTAEILLEKTSNVYVFSSGIKSRLNALYLPFLSRFVSYYNNDLARIRGCNLSFWKNDILKVNGFNEDFEGWGREDTEFMVRMLNNDIRCLKMKLEGFGYHLYHPESSKAMLMENQRILDEAIRLRATRCENGIDKYLAIHNTKIVA